MKDIKGYEGLYAVTSCGKVWSYRNNRWLTPRVTEKGYLIVSLSKDGKFKNYKIHRLVAETYLDNSNNYPDVHHLNNIRTDNYLGNLRWISHKENMIYRYVEWLRSFGILVKIPQDFRI